MPTIAEKHRTLQVHECTAIANLFGEELAAPEGLEPPTLSSED